MICIFLLVDLKRKKKIHYEINNEDNTESSSKNSNNNNKKNKEQACKRVGSLKVDAKKIKSNVTRSKR